MKEKEKSLLIIESILMFYKEQGLTEADEICQKIFTEADSISEDTILSFVPDGDDSIDSSLKTAILQDLGFSLVAYVFDKNPLKRIIIFWEDLMSLIIDIEAIEGNALFHKSVEWAKEVEEGVQLDKLPSDLFSEIISDEFYKELSKDGQ